MDRYEIIMTPDAISDLTELRNYIVGVLHAPETAGKYVRAIREEIATLDTMPARIAPVPDEPWHSRGIRKMIVKNFYVYFRIDSDAMRVYILNVIYARRDQLKLLSELL
jgi:toxin ParE1/3/4